MIRIALDLDDVLFGFTEAYEKKFNKQKNYRTNKIITRNVQKLRKDKKFWENLPKLRDLKGFTPELYCTKRTSSKTYAKNALEKHGFPKRPIYRVLTQTANKADYIKGKADVLIDDSLFNIKQALTVKFPAILLTTPENKNMDCKYRITDLSIDEIIPMYDIIINDINNNKICANARF